MSVQFDENKMEEKLVQHEAIASIKHNNWFIYHVFDELRSMSSNGFNSLENIDFTMLYHLFDACISCTINSSSASSIAKKEIINGSAFKWMKIQTKEIAFKLHVFKEDNRTEQQQQKLHIKNVE